MVGLTAVLADREARGEVEGHRDPQAPARVVEILSALVRHEARARDPAVVEGPEGTQVENRPVRDPQDHPRTSEIGLEERDA